MNKGVTILAAPRCYDCFRPRELCFCAAIPRVANRTDVLILQHAKERHHRFNTARIVDRALQRCRLLVVHPADFAAQTLPLLAQAGLLFPGGTETELSELPQAQRPHQLIVIDGTWHQAKTIVRDMPVLGSLPRYRLSPKAPGNYRIRREPTATSLSTLEATVAALQLLEPDTQNVERLLEAFGKMVGDQLAHPNSRNAWRRKRTHNRPSRKIPVGLQGDPNHLVIAYGEAAPDSLRSKKSRKEPLYWVAQRLGTGEQFACTIGTDKPLSDSFLHHLMLPESFFAHSTAREDFFRQWASFLKPTDTLIVYHKGTLEMLHEASADNAAIVLKPICNNLQLHLPSLDQLPWAESSILSQSTLPGRAGCRLASVLALVRKLRLLGNT